LWHFPSSPLGEWRRQPEPRTEVPAVRDVPRDAKHAVTQMTVRPLNVHSRYAYCVDCDDSLKA